MRTTAAVARALGLLGAFLVVSLVGGVLFAGLFLPMVGATGSITTGSVDFFNSIDSSLHEPPLSQGSTMYAADGKTVIAHFYEENRVVTSLNRVAPIMRQAIVAIEDYRFYEHGGVDPKGLLRAFVNNSVNDGSIQGASTLTQQYIKNVLVESAVAAGDKNAAAAAVARDNGRKVREIRMAIQLEKTKSKNEILEGYLNIANFGRNNYGIEAASQYYFQITAANLNLPQAALLAGLVQKPEGYNPFKHPALAKERRTTVLMRMRDLKIITEAQYQTAKVAPMPTKPQPALSGCITARAHGYFCDYVYKVLLTDDRYKKLGADATTRENAIKRGGYKFVTTLDPKLEQAATDALMTKVPPADQSGVVTSSVTVEPGTGKVLSIAQNRYFSNNPGPGQTEVNFGVDKVYGGSTGFQTGSTFKAYTLATWLAQGKGLYDNVNGDLTDRPRSDFTACGKTLRGENYKFGNSEGHGIPNVDVLHATTESINTAFVDMESRLDICDITKVAESMGVHTASPADPNCFANGVTSPIHMPTQCPALTLGTFEISPMTMANAYATFAADGVYCQPVAVTSVTDRTGKTVPVSPSTCTQAISADVAHGVTYALKRVITQPGATATNISPLPWPGAGKTGTTDSSIRVWFVGYSHSRSTAVMVGDPKIYVHGTLDSPGPLSLNNRKIGKTPYGHVFGATIAAPLWKTIMTAAMDGQKPDDWPDPPAKMLQGSGIKVADVVGHPIDEAKAILEGQGFTVKVGKPVKSAITPESVAKTSPPAGGRLEPGSRVIIYPGDGSVAPTPDPNNPGGGVNPGNGNGNPGNGNGNGNGGGIPVLAALPTP